MKPHVYIPKALCVFLLILVFVRSLNCFLCPVSHLNLDLSHLLVWYHETQVVTREIPITDLKKTNSTQGTQTLNMLQDRCKWNMHPCRYPWLDTTPVRPFYWALLWAKGTGFSWTFFLKQIALWFNVLLSWTHSMWSVWKALSLTE